jgi:hypothetical protein
MQARRVAKELGKSQVIILMIDEKAGTIITASYGTNGERCAEAGRMAEIVYSAVYDHLFSTTRKLWLWSKAQAEVS